MTAATLDDCARRWARMLEDHEAEVSGRRVVEVRPRVAARIGVQPGTLESLRKGRIKGVRGWIAERIRLAAIELLEAEQRRVTHELEMARRSGCGPGDERFQAVAASAARLSALIAEGEERS